MCEFIQTFLKFPSKCSKNIKIHDFQYVPPIFSPNTTTENLGTALILNTPIAHVYNYKRPNAK